ncbi:MAG: MltA-interacting protein [Paracidovorax wautersii]|uniref:MltA-interacting protein n=1 Tax=Paracidovorax wautersii TaxID=1177982 RepID=A0A7V8FKN1_9BURK|nr:MAG: MltA-interacting protein [Paracidovorax wautersii]
MTHVSRAPRAPARPGLAAIAAAAALAAAGVSPAMAQTTAAGTPGQSQWGLGAAAFWTDHAYRDFDNKVRPLPMVSYENKWISASVPTLDLKLPSGSDALSFRLRARYAGDGYKASDSPYLDGMDKRKSSVWVGGAVLWKTDVVNLSAELLADAMRESKGTRAKLQAERRFAFGAIGLTPRLATEWVDSKYVDYYYGVQASEVRAGRSRYEGDSTVNVQAGLRVDYTLARQHTFFVDFNATRLGSAIKDSPLIDKSTQTGVGVGYLYRF